MEQNTFARAVQIPGTGMRLKFQSEICKIERSIAQIMAFTILLAFSMESFCCCISWWVMNGAIKLKWIVSLRLQHCCLPQFLPWSGTTMKDAILFVLVGSEPVLGHSDFGASLFLVIGFVLFCFFFFFVLPAASPGGARPRCVLYSSCLLYTSPSPRD